MARRRDRRRQQQQRRRGLAHPSEASSGLNGFSQPHECPDQGEGSGISSPTSSMSARPGFARTAIFGRERKGQNFPPDAKEKRANAAAEAVNPNAGQFELGSEFDAAAKVGVPLCIWTNSQVRRILASRTSFSFYLGKTITLCRGSRSGPSTALFPIPVPVMGLWEVGLRKMNSASRKLQAQRKLLHLAVVALNYLHERSPLSSLGLLQRRPAQHHLDVFARLMTMIKACVLSNEVTMARCGRKSFQFGARLKELYQVLRDEGLGERSKYHQLRSEVPVDLRNDGAEELRPYRPLDASRLKITGKGQWDCTPYIGDLFYMPFLEPRFNQFEVEVPDHLCPDVSKEDPAEIEELAKVWDARDLLKFVPSELCPQSRRYFTRVFNNYKSPEADRQIGDRRGQNWREGRILGGPSNQLPAGSTLLQIMPERYKQGLKGYATDRRDFYHQFGVSWERSCTNVTYPLLPLGNFAGLKAYEACLESFPNRKGGKKDRSLIGDELPGQRRSILCSDESQVAIAFSALFQGDHLGVDIACSSHEGLLSEGGLLEKYSRLVADRAILNDDVTEGLVIDDYFCIAKCDVDDVGADGLGLGKLLTAKEIYTSQDIYGSDDKDVIGERRFKVVGAEVDARRELVREGAVLCAAPADKRLALASVAALSSSWPFTSDSLHPSLVGSLVSAFMFRRPMMAIMNEVFHVIPAVELDSEAPMLRKLGRGAAEELAIAAALLPVMASNLAVPVSSRLYATDASNHMGGIASTEVPEELAKVLWRSADKKGKNVPMMSTQKALLREYDPDFEEEEVDVEDAEDGGERAQRPIGLSFDFVEVFGGAGVVTRHLCQMGVVCAPVLDISYSPHYDLTVPRTVSWVIFMLEQRRLKAVLVAPPCTTFSPAAYPPVRSYKNPRGFIRALWKVRHGNRLASSGMVVMFACRRNDAMGLLEQPRRSKMRWLDIWRCLVELGMEEIFLASCAYGSCHMKEFCFGAINMVVGHLARPCTRDHDHVRIQGKFTKGSATYCDGLARALAETFRDHLLRREKAERSAELRADGLEDVVSNDLALSYNWVTEDAWRWKGKSHINILESASTLRLMRKLARGGGDVRAVYLGDSHVSRSSLARGRTSSNAMRPVLKQSASLSVAYGLYMAGRFAPTRMMPADHPSRGQQIPPPVQHSVTRALDLPELGFLVSLPRLKRWISNWSRLVLLLQPNIISFHAQPSSYRIYPASHLPNPHLFMDFDSSLGFPGEGPGFGFVAWILSIAMKHPSRKGSLLNGFLLGVLGACVDGARTIPKGISHGDVSRAAARAGIELQDGRRTTEATAAARIDLLERFKEWLSSSGIVFEDVFLANPPDLDRVNKLLCDFGRFLFRAGKPYYHYSETINAVAARRPVLRRTLQQAWDLAFMWGSYEPTEHHVGMPFQILLACLSVMLLWGWKQEAACIALAWGALLRFGEVFKAVRKDLILPMDVAGSIDFLLIRIEEPKTRYRAARHQSGKMEQPDLISVVSLGLGKLKSGDALWPFHGATLRHRLNKVLASLGLPHRPGQKPKPLSLASMRAGGATWLITQTEQPDLVKRRGRWASMRVMEIYLQEVSAASYLNDLETTVKDKILDAMELFPEVLQTALIFDSYGYPSATWPWFFKHGSSRQVGTGKMGAI